MKYKIKLSNFTNHEIDQIRSEANFSLEQLRVFEALCADTHYDYAIIDHLGLSRNRYYHIKKVVMAKVERIILKSGYKTDTK